jgi:uncharacterized membrane protein
MGVLATAVAGYALAVILLPSFGPPFVHDRRESVPLALYAHLGGGALALALGPWQFRRRTRRRALGVHRWTGRVYLAAVAVGGVGALGLAPISQHGLVTHVGFGLLAILWLVATATAYLRIRSGDVRAHRRWMIRSYALTFAAVTLRIYLPLSAIAGISFPDAYQVVAWLCWVPNLVVAEWLIIGREGAVADELAPAVRS